MIGYNEVDTIFFDWGGVIAADPGGDFLKSLLVDIGANDDQIDDIFSSYKLSFMKGQITEDEYWHNLKSKYGLAIHDSISEEFNNWNGLIREEPVVKLIKKAKDQGYKIAILSNVIEPTYNVLQKAGYYDDFDAVIASCKEGLAKPEQEIYDLALKRLNTTAKKSLFIDDKRVNLAPAEAMGFKTILARNTEQLTKDLGVYIN